MTPYHSMEIYEDDASIARIVADLFAQTRRLDQPCLLIARSAVNDMVRQALSNSNMAMTGITILSSEEMLADLVSDTLADPARFSALIGGLLNRLCVERDVCIVTIYSDMADLLLQRNNPRGAVSFELLWNELATHHAFTLACGYSVATMRKKSPTFAELERLCLAHNRLNTPRCAS